MDGSIPNAKPGLITAVRQRAREFFHRDLDTLLRNVSGIIHVGANAGQERELYARHNLNVIWIEPIPEVFAKLQRNLRKFPRQRAFQYLVTEKDDEEYQFHIANNSGASSSIFDFKLHTEIWPEVKFERTVPLKSITLATMVEQEQIDLTEHDALIMDTQGSELLVLRGAESILHHFRYVKTEAADFESYSGCCQVADIAEFLLSRGYREFYRRAFASRPEGGNYYDIIYRRPWRPFRR
jgi:FkbM family methyltransferase